MTLQEIKKILPTINQVVFELPNGRFVPSHFHITEVGEITKHFIDCGGTIRNEKVANFQLWEANDLEHRLAPTKLLNIILLAESKLQLGNLDIEVEYQGSTIEKYGLDFNGEHFLLVAKQTNCLAQDKCGIPPEKLKINLAEIKSCSPGSGCC